MLTQYNKDSIKGEWKNFKGAVKKKWGKFTDDDLLKIEGSYDQLAGKLQKVYGYSKERAESELEDVWNGFKDKTSEMKSKDEDSEDMEAAADNDSDDSADMDEPKRDPKRDMSDKDKNSSPQRYTND